MPSHVSLPSPPAPAGTVRLTGTAGPGRLPASVLPASAAPDPDLFPPPPTVVLVESRWCGHHPTYFREFAAALLRNGTRVLALCPEPERLAEMLPDIYGAALLEPASGRIHATAFQEPAGRSWLSGREHDPVRTFRRWRSLKRSLGAAVQETGWQPDLVLFPYLDAFLRFQIVPGLPQWALGPVPWAGLYFRNHHFKPTVAPPPWVAWLKGDISLRHPNCLAVGVLDERPRDTMSRFFHSTPVIGFPDITDETFPVSDSALAKEIKRKAMGRPVVGLVGLERRKGFLTLLKVALESPDAHRWFFCLAGSYCPETLDPAEDRWARAIAARIATGEIDHIHFDPDAPHVRDGNDYNSLICAFDVIYAAYESFQGSSNALTKAAVFERPVVATKGECVGDRTDTFRLGITIDEGNTAQAAQAIHTLITRNGPDHPRYADYRSQHSRQSLDAALRSVLDQAMENGAG